MGHEVEKGYDMTGRMQTHRPRAIQISYQWLILIHFIIILYKQIYLKLVLSVLNHQGTVQVPSANLGKFSRPWCKSFECFESLRAMAALLKSPQNHENERKIAAKINNEPGHEEPKWLAVQAVKTVSSAQWQHQSEESLLRRHMWSATPVMILRDSRKVSNS